MSTTQPLLCARGSCLLLSDELMDIFVLLGFAVPSPLSSREKEKKEPNVYVCVCVLVHMVLGISERALFMGSSE